MNNELGKKIKLLREEKELSQLELAKILNISNSTLSQYEAGNRVPGDDIKKKIADYFNVSVDFLLGRTEERNPYTNDKDLDKIDKFLLELKEEMEKEELEFDETSPQELIETYKLLLEFKKKMKKE